MRAGKSSTPEAILERLGADGKVVQVLASSARELKPAVEKLLGLPFAHFTRCVVLPQGEFARFLHDEPAKRRDLLTRLLDLEVYDRIGQLARQHAAAAKQAMEIHERQRAGLPDATEAARAAAEAAARRASSSCITTSTERARATRSSSRRSRRPTHAPAAPPRSWPSSTRSPFRARSRSSPASAEAATAKARAMSEATAAAQAALTELDAAVDALPNRVELERARDAHATASTLADAIDAARTAEAEATAATEQVAAVAERADTHLRDAEVALERRTRRARRARAGDPPRCR